MVTLSYVALATGLRQRPLVRESCQAGLSDANHRVCDWQSRLLEFHRLTNNRVSFPSSFRKHNKLPKFLLVEDHFFNRVQYSTKALWLVNSTTKFLSSVSTFGFNQTLSRRQRNIYIGLVRSCQINARSRGSILPYLSIFIRDFSMNAVDIGINLHG